MTTTVAVLFGIVVFQAVVILTLKSRYNRLKEKHRDLLKHCAEQLEAYAAFYRGFAEYRARHDPIKTNVVRLERNRPK